MATLPPILRGRRARWLAIAFVAVVLLRIALPYAIEAAIGWGGERATGGQVAVSNVDLGLLRGRVVLDDLAVAGVGHPPTAEGAIDPETALLRWDRLDLNLEWTELLKGRIRLSDLSLAGPRARVELDDAGAPILPAPPVEEGVEPSPEDATETEDEVAVEPDGEGGGGWPILVDRLELTELDVQVLDGHESTPAIDAGMEALRLSAISFDDSGLGLGAIGFEAPKLRVRRDFVFAEPIPGDSAGDSPEPAEATPPPDATGSSATHRMDELRIQRAEFVVLTSAGPLHVALQVDATGVTTEPGAHFPVAVRLEIEDGSLDLEGEVGTAPPSFEGQLRWEQLPLPPITMLARPDLAGWVASHSASGELQIGFHLEAEGELPAGLALSGRFASHDLHFRDPESEDFSIGWKRFTIPIDDVFVPLGDGAEAKPVRVSLGAVELDSPHATYRQPTEALDRLFPPTDGDANGDSASAEPEGTSGPEPIVSIASFKMTGGELEYRDRSIRPTYTGRVRALAMDLRDIALPAQTVGRSSMSAQLPVRSKLAITGSHGKRRSQVDLQLDQLSLTPLNPYVVDAAGYKVREGRVTLETHAKRNGERWDVDNDLVLEKLGLASMGTGKLDQMIGIPVDLALALLRDLEGNITLGIPVGVDPSGLSVGIGSIVRDAIRAAIAGAATSPLKMMGAAFSSDGGLAVDPIRMIPGGIEPVDAQVDALGRLGDLLEARPMLAIELRGGAGPEDRDGLAEQILIERLAADGDLPEVEDAGFLAKRRVRGALKDRGQGKPGDLKAEDVALLARYRVATDVPPERFEALARERATTLAGRAHARGIDPTQVRVADEVDDDHVGVILGFQAR